MSSACSKSSGSGGVGEVAPSRTATSALDPFFDLLGLAALVGLADSSCLAAYSAASLDSICFSRSPCTARIPCISSSSSARRKRPSAISIASWRCSGRSAALAPFAIASTATPLSSARECSAPMLSILSITSRSSTDSSSTSASSSFLRASRSASAPPLICSSMVLLRSTITSCLSMLVSWSAPSTTPTRARPASASSPIVSSACSSRRSDWKRSANSSSSYSFKHVLTRFSISARTDCCFLSAAAAAFDAAVSIAAVDRWVRAPSGPTSACLPTDEGVSPGTPRCAPSPAPRGRPPSPHIARHVLHRCTPCGMWPLARATAPHLTPLVRAEYAREKGPGSAADALQLSSGDVE